MNGIFGVIDGSLKVSIVDSTMMWIVHRAMDKAHERVKSREGVIERLHEISKFYELSVMQLDGCIKLVREETDAHNPETSHQEVLAGLAEIRNRLQRRLYESELAILQRDRELADRFESESKLRQALEITERELVSSQEDLVIARSRSGESSNLSHQEGENENRDEEFCELRDSVDRQVWKIREKLEFDDYEPEVEKRNHRINDVKVEEMGSDIDILKETLDIAFGKMQSAIFHSEMGPIEQQIKSSIENSIMSIFLKGFVRDSQEDLEEEARRKEKQVSVSMNEHWSDLMNEVTGLCEDLKPLIGQNGEECHILDLGSRSPKSEEEIPVGLKSRFQEVLEKLDNLVILNAKVNKSLGQNGDYKEEDISQEKGKQVSKNSRQKSDVETLEYIWGKIHKQQDEEDIEMQNQICMRRQEREEKKFQNIMMEEIYITLFQGLREQFCNDLSSWELEILISDSICRDFFRSMFNQLDETMESYKIGAQIKDEIYHVVFKEIMEDYCSIYDFVLDKSRDVKDENRHISSSQCLECKIRQEIYGIPFTVMLKKWQKSIEEHTTESLLREKISWLVFGETIKNISYKANHCPHTKFFNDFHPDSQITIKEDVCLVFFRDMVREWEEKIEACNLETLIREEICYTILNEAEREVCNSYKKVDVPIQGSELNATFGGREIRTSDLLTEDICLNKLNYAQVGPIQDSDILEKRPSGERLGEDTKTSMGSLIQKLNLLSEGIEVVEKLVLSSSFDIMDDNSNLKPIALECGFDESKATSLESKDTQCILNSLSNKLAKTMKHFNKKFFVGELKSSLETIVRAPENVCQLSRVGENVPDRKLPLSELHNMQLNKSDSKCLKLRELPHIFYNFELMANKKLEAIMLRLEEMKHTLDPIPQVMASLRENESLYKKAFIRRCQNLRKAENEVDLLGDQVNILVRLIEKIYSILNQHSPVLQQYFEVSEILRLIKKEVAVIVCTT